MKTRLGIIFGGKSSEHEVSLSSAYSVISAADKNKYDIVTIGITKSGVWKLYEGPYENIKDGSWEKDAKDILWEDLPKMIDFALPILHGPNGEDGTVQGLFKLLNIPFGGCGVTGASATMDKVIAKQVFANAGLRQTPYVAFDEGTYSEETLKEIDSKLKYPLFVKPVNMGSSVGISKVYSFEELAAAIEFAFRYDTRIVVEQGVNCREVETGIIGNSVLWQAEVGEILPGADFYDYDAKYTEGASQMQIPADITPAQREEIFRMAQTAYRALNCQGFSRLDFMIDKDSGEVFINEINSIPGFTVTSMFPSLCMARGMSYPEIIDKIVELGYERYHAENRR